MKLPPEFRQYLMAAKPLGFDLFDVLKRAESQVDRNQKIAWILDRQDLTTLERAANALVSIGWRAEDAEDL
jgi:hypothetical protein